MPNREVLEMWTTTKKVQVKKKNKSLPTAGHLLLFGNAGFVTDAFDQDENELVEQTVYMVRLKRKPEDGGNFSREVDPTAWNRLRVGGQMYSLK